MSISQIEELGLETFPEREKELQSALAALRSERTLDVACLLVTDITLHHSLLLVDGDARVIDAIDYPRLRKNVFDLEGVVSRKKQFFPYLSNRLARIDRVAESHVKRRLKPRIRVRNDRVVIQPLRVVVAHDPG